MKLLKEAIKKDIEGEFIEAADLYQKVIDQTQNLDAYLNLAVLYFQFTDLGINAGSKLPLEFIKKAHISYEEIINECILKYPENSEAKFWRKYFDYFVKATDLTSQEITEIISHDKSSLVPFFFLYLLEPEKYERERDKLIKECKRLLTSKNTWVLSLIEDV